MKAVVTARGTAMIGFFGHSQKDRVLSDLVKQQEHNGLADCRWNAGSQQVSSKQTAELQGCPVSGPHQASS